MIDTSTVTSCNISGLLPSSTYDIAMEGAYDPETCHAENNTYNPGLYLILKGVTVVVGTVNTPTTFTPDYVGAAITRLWDFGDGFTSTEFAPSHIYTAPGEYTATLTISNLLLENPIVYSMEVAVSMRPVFRSITVQPISRRDSRNVLLYADVPYSTGLVWDILSSGDWVQIATGNSAEISLPAFGLHSIRCTATGEHGTTVAETVYSALKNSVDIHQQCLGLSR